MLTQGTRYEFSTTVALPFEEAVERTRAELAVEGFGVLTEIDVKATLKKKLNVDFRPYVILGACNPPFAYRALQAERHLGVLLPCNVVVYAGDEPGTSVVSAMDPASALELVGKPEVAEVGHEVKARLERVLRRVAGEL